MKWKPRDCALWHRWFAWRPVRTEDGQWIWLEHVERSFDRHGYCRGPYLIEVSTWAYRLIEGGGR